jgi:peptide/nickel transport system ATP-binding protein
MREARMTTPLLKVEDLRIALAGDDRTYNAVESMSFEIGRGDAFGLVGESGCGKSITALAVMGLLRRPLSLGGGKIILDGQEIQDATPAEMRALRGSRIGMIFQEPMTALNPLSPVGRQIAEMFVLHQGANWSEAMDRAEEALRQVRVPSPERRIKDFPHQLSGGMRQRVMIAIALACSPELLIADEPTTALDVTVQAEIIDLMAELCAAKGTAILMISHDLGLVANMCKHVAVMYAGRIVEAQVADAIFATPRHPYTQGLIDSLPRLGERARRGQQRLREIAGVVPSIATYPPGCRFNPRCPAVTEVCRSVAPEVTPLPAEGIVRCHHHG